MVVVAVVGIGRRKSVRLYPRVVLLLLTSALPDSSALLLSCTGVAPRQASRAARFLPSLSNQGFCCGTPLSLFPMLSANVATHSGTESERGETVFSIRRSAKISSPPEPAFAASGAVLEPQHTLRFPCRLAARPCRRPDVRAILLLDSLKDEAVLQASRSGHQQCLTGTSPVANDCD